MYDTRPPSSGSGFRWGAWIGGAAGLLLLFGILGFCAATTTTPVDRIGVNYGGGPIEDRNFQKIIPPGSGLTITGFMDPTYTYPVTQRSYIISASGGDVVGTVGGASIDKVRVEFEVATYFALNTDLLQKFHEKLGLKYHAWDDEGWNHLLTDTLQQQIKFAIQREAAKYEAAALWADEPTKVALQRSIGLSLKDEVHKVMGDDYFCGVGFTPGTCPDFTFVVNKVILPAEVERALEANRTSEIMVQTRTNEVQQAEQQALAIEKLNEALEASGGAYPLLKAVESGKVTFWVIDGNQDLTITAPSTGAAPTTTTTVPAG